jgi:hypothetical protein
VVAGLEEALFKEDPEDKVTYLLCHLVKVTMGVVVQARLVLTLVKVEAVEVLVM